MYIITCFLLQIHVVDENREYTQWTDKEEESQDPDFVNGNTGIVTVKKALNDLHFKLANEGYNQVNKQIKFCYQK